MDVIVLIGRILFCLIFLASGVNHLVQRTPMAQYAGSMGVPSPAVLVPLTGIQILVGGLMVLLGIWADLGLLILIAFLVPAALTMHAFWKFEGEERTGQQAHFMKNIALAGAAFALFGLIAYVGADLGLTITEPLFDLS